MTATCFGFRNTSMRCKISVSHFIGEVFLHLEVLSLSRDFPGGSDGKESACNVGDLRLIPGLGRSPGGGNGNPF